MNSVLGLHHVTAIAGSPQDNIDFYSGVLGLRLVKRSVNQDDPATYHLFYADAEGRPGTDLTFFPWGQLPPKRAGTGLSMEVSLAVPPGSLPYWSDRLPRYGIGLGSSELRFGERTLPFTDPHGLEVALVESDNALRRPFTPWAEGPVPAEHQVRGLHGARIWERDAAATGRFLTDVLGLHFQGQEDAWMRFSVRDGRSGSHIDVRGFPDLARGTWGVGGIHHLAWRVADDDHQREMREQVRASGIEPTPVIDRFWFKSVYFNEPGGVIFELATDGPGFTVDEPSDQLGELLVLPPWLEPHRAHIEAALPPLRPPDPSRLRRKARVRVGA